MHSEPSKAAMERVSLFRRIIMGAGYLEGDGEHPGTGMCVMLCMMTAAAGASGGGWIGFAGGLVIGALAYVPMWMIGCVGRADAYLRRNRGYTITKGVGE